MKTRALVAVLLAMTAGLFWWTWRGDDGEASPRAGALREPTGEGAGPPASAEREARAQRRVAAAAARSAGEVAAPEAPAAEAAAAPPDPDDGAPPSPSASAAALREHLDASFDQQAADATWSGAARLEIAQKFAALMPPSSTMKAVECRATMCRMEMVYDDLAQYQAFMSRLSPEALPWNGTLFSTPLGDPSVGPVTFVAFLSRAGQQLAVE